MSKRRSKNDLNPLNIKPTSNEDIQKKLAKYGMAVKFFPYHELKNVSSIEELMPFSIILFELHYPVGHWGAVFRNTDDEDKPQINFFDPTGHKMDELNEIDFNNILGREAVNADFTWLTKLLYETGESVIWNSDELQGPTSNTCGEWTTCRLRYYQVQNDDFNECFMSYPLETREDLIIKLYNSL
jgi:hypothetical protein